ncbi:hypothetical protein CFC21_105860 [Triticum aestivum]|uniref:Wall-associated receptor kinase galacturonan-binding domain-containing protein n=2 Tax=Triticum aestivum TaxID=4565 RepID=A0A9R1MCU2_WHEAT|nr:hypothetical protein CFC21_105859 [Triticum aestivum]KAF7105018.1 hypothetical protein CFC21_105860 [Triticum aestivum]
MCRCHPGYHANAAMPGGCVNHTDTHAGNCTRFCGGVHLPFPFGITGMGSAAGCYHPEFNLTCDKTQDPPRLRLGDGGQFLVEKIHLKNATVRAVYPGAFVNNTELDGQK